MPKPQDTKPASIPAVILAGGRASRMGGGDKGLCDLAGQSLLARIRDRLAPQCAALALNANGPPARFAALGLPVLPDGIAGQPGPLAGVLAAMDWAAGHGAQAVVTLSCDTPFLPNDLIARLSASGGMMTAATRDRAGRLHLHPTCTHWPVALRAPLRQWLDSGQRRMRDFIHLHDAGRAIWDSTPFDPFFNINSPEDLRRAEAIIAAPAKKGMTDEPS